MVVATKEQKTKNLFSALKPNHLLVTPQVSRQKKGFFYIQMPPLLLSLDGVSKGDEGKSSS